MPGRDDAADDAKPAAAKPADAKPADAKPAGPKQVDERGVPYITLTQLLKKEQIAGSGGEAKALAREGIATVNGEAEARPGRKLRQGDKVVVRGKTIVVSIV